MHDWVVSTSQSGATGNALSETYTDIDGNTHTNDTAAYRLAKFKTEFEDYFNMHYSLIYYVYTFFALMVDQRAKNMFLTYWGSEGKWYPYFYDNDTCFGIDNEGRLLLDYYHEDTDTINDANVYNGQNSALWTNFREAFADEIQETYQQLRSDDLITYDKLVEQFITKGSDKWSESIYNEDSEFKYVSMLREDNDASNLTQLRGSGEEHFRYFVENRINYCDSKWYASDYANDYVRLRVYTPSTWAGIEPNADITATYFSNIYAGVRYGANATLQQERVEHGVPITFEAPNNTFNNTETAIYGASQLSSLGDLSALYCGGIVVDKASKLIELKIGDTTEGYSNDNLVELSVGTNKLLKKINVCNCPNLTDPLNLSGCPNIEEVYATGSGITGMELIDGGCLKIAKLPASIVNLTLKNQLYIEELTLESYESLKTLWVENSPTLDTLAILNLGINIERVRLTNVDWDYPDASVLLGLIERNYAGKDENGTDIDTMWLDGKCHIKALTGTELKTIKEAFPHLTVTYNTLTSYLTFMTDDGSTELGRQEIKNGGDGDGSVVVDPNSLECELGGIEYQTGELTESNTRLRTNYIPTNGVSSFSIKFTDMLFTKFLIRAYKADGSFVAIKSNRSDAWTGTITSNWYIIGSGEGTIDLNNYLIPAGLTASDITHIRIILAIDDTTVITGITGIITINDSIYNLGTETLTKPPTVQYTYTFAGWSLTPGGEADPDALKNVEADRIVYAAYSKTLRNYIVRFYVEGVLKETQTVPYGGTATYTGETPVSQYDYLEFTGWKPEPTNIAGNTDCHAQFYDNREITDDWATIAAACLDGTATTKYAVGAYKGLDITYEDGTTETIPMEVAAHNHDELADGINKWELLPNPSGINHVGTNSIAYLNGSIYIFNNKRLYTHDGSKFVEISGSVFPITIKTSGYICAYNNEIHMVGINVDNTTFSHYAWNGTEWYKIADHSNAKSYGNYGFGVSNGELYAMSLYSIIKFNGTEWMTVPFPPSTISDSTSRIFILDGDVYFSGRLNTLYKLEGTDFVESDIVCPAPKLNVYRLYGELYTIYSNIVYKYSDGEWVGVDKIPTSYKYIACSMDNEIYVVGQAVENRYNMWKWSGPGWKQSNIATTLSNPESMGIVEYQGKLHMIGSYYAQAGHWTYDGTEFVALDPCPYYLPDCRHVVYNDEIHTMGDGKHYKYDGTEWSIVSELSFTINNQARVVYDNCIYVADGTNPKIIHKYDGVEWINLGNKGVVLRQMTVYNDELYCTDNANIYKLENETLVNVGKMPASFASTLGNTATQISFISYNGKIHIFHSSCGHYTWDGSKFELVSNNIASMLGNSESSVVYQGKLYTARSYNRNLYVLENPKATLTFVAKNLLKDKRQWSSSNNTTGGWPKSEIRAWLNGDFINTLPIDLQTVIASVKKYSRAFTKYSNALFVASDVISYDKAFLLSSFETGEGISNYDIPTDAYDIFTDRSSRIRASVDEQFTAWYLRTIVNNDSKRAIVIYENGSWKGAPDNSIALHGVLIGFCI